jgi:peroxiredoxin Q/BCP
VGLHRGTGTSKETTMALEIGKKAPDFTLLDENGERVKLSQLKGRRVIVFFYPKAMTSGCTREACDFRDEVAAFEKKDAAVLGVSKDAPAAQKRFKEKYRLPFPLLSDESLEVHKAWGVWGEKNMYGKKVMGTIRTTVVVGPDGKVERVFPKVKVDGHVAAVLESL